VTAGKPQCSTRCRALAAFLFACSLFSGHSSSASGQEIPHVSVSGAVRIAVVKSLDLPEYNLALEGFVNKLDEAGHRPTIDSYLLERSDSANAQLLERIGATHPDLILALGTRAARESAKFPSQIPVIYSMVLSPPDGAPSAAHANMTGAVLTIPLATQIDELKRAFPTLKHVGIISDPSRTKGLADSARALCLAHGLQAHVAWANGEAEVPDAVRQLKDSIEVLWMIPDETVLTPRSSRFIIFELIKSGVPVIGLSSAYVKAGALMSLDCNYSDIGRQSAELAVRVLAGQKPGLLPYAIPRTYTRSVNAKIIEHVRIRMDKKIVEDSNVVTF
jgi:ABC-type uncharacterized transport system substrate-binding protein